MQKNKNVTNVEIIEAIKPIIQQIIAESGWIVGPNNKGSVLFTTTLLNKHIPKNGTKSWLNHQSFTFSIFYDKKFYLITKILPGNNKTRTLLSSALSNIKCLKKPKKNRIWINHIWHSINLTMADFAGKNKNEIKIMLKKDWHKITAEVNKVEAELLKHSKELKNMLPHPDNHYVLLSTQNSRLRIIKPVPAFNKLPSAA